MISAYCKALDTITFPQLIPLLSTAGALLNFTVSLLLSLVPHPHLSCMLIYNPLPPYIKARNIFFFSYKHGTGNMP